MPLPKEKIIDLYNQFTKANPWPEWFTSYLGAVEKIASLSDEQLSTPETQESLWRVRDIAAIGPGREC